MLDVVSLCFSIAVCINVDSVAVLTVPAVSHRCNTDVTTKHSQHALTGLSVIAQALSPASCPAVQGFSGSARMLSTAVKH